MTVKGARELKKTLRDEIDKGIDVDFNKQLIALLDRASIKAITKGYDSFFNKNKIKNES